MGADVGVRGVEAERLATSKPHSRIAHACALVTDAVRAADLARARAIPLAVAGGTRLLEKNLLRTMLYVARLAPALADPAPCTATAHAAHHAAAASSR